MCPFLSCNVKDGDGIGVCKAIKKGWNIFFDK